MCTTLSVATPLSDSLDFDVFLSNCPVLIEGRELLTDLVLFDVMDFDLILEWIGCLSTLLQLIVGEKR